MPLDSANTREPPLESVAVRRLLLGLGAGLALLLGPLAVRLFDNVWLVRLLDAIASGERQNLLLGLTCGGAWIVLAVLNAVAFRLRPSASTRRAGARYPASSTAGTSEPRCCSSWVAG